MITDVVELAHRWLEVLPEGEFDKLPGQIAEDFVLRLPYAPPGVPTEFAGREAAQKALSESAKGRGKLSFDNVVLLRTEDPELLVATATGGATMGNGKLYRNSYVIFVRIRDGAVIEHIEYLNPLNVIAAFSD
jgi:ketosteroid isomerase-like protein